MKQIFTTLFCALITLAVQAQSKFGHLTIVSEENEPFYLYINNVQYNNDPLTIIRIEEITDKVLNCKIEYKNKRLGTVIADRVAIADFDGYMQDVTYLLSTKRRGNQALMVYKIIPMDNMDVDVDREELYIWGKPTRPFRKSSTTYREGTSRTRKPSFRDTDRRQWPDGPTNPSRDHDRKNDYHCKPMSIKDYKDAYETIKNTSFDDSKLKIAETIVKNNCISTEQAIDIIKLLSFDKNKLTFAKLAYHYVYDPNNYYKVINAFSFSSSKDEITNYINANKR